MRARTLLLTAFAALLLAIPTSAAQQQAAMTVRLSPSGHLFAPGDSNGTYGMMQITFDQTAAVLQPQGIPVTYAITKAPEWIAASISPSSDVIPTDGIWGGVSKTVVRMFSIQLDALANATGDRVDALEVTAVTHPGMGGIPVSAKGQITIHLIAGTDPCPAAAQDAGASGSSASSSSSTDTPVHVQSSAVSIPTISYVALGGFGLVGAGVGLFLRRRL